MPETNVAPFLRWAGGKRQLQAALLALVPQRIVGRYIEPFLGAGSLFFALAPEKSVLSDANHHLIDAYRQIRTNPDAVRRALRVHIHSHSSRYYYRTRTAYNKSRLSAAQAARFIYLNKTCFNGIFRVNRRGEFNVPKGSKKSLSVPEKQEFDRISALLRDAELKAADFSEVLAGAEPDDFVYLDPPYPALTDTAYFTHYTADRFTPKSQEKLAECVLRIHNLGTRFLMSNADTEMIRSLYRPFNIREVPVTRFISCKGVRYTAGELLVKNY